MKDNTDWRKAWDAMHGEVPREEKPASTAPMVKSVRVKRNIQIQEVNEPPAPTTFDTTVVYASDALPEWFQDLQSIVEDRDFTAMSINIGKGRVYYRITIAHEKAEEKTTHEQ